MKHSLLFALQLFQLALVLALGVSIAIPLPATARNGILLLLILSSGYSAFAVFRHVRGPLRDAAAYLSQIRRTLVEPLGRAISELSIGDLTVRIEDKTEQSFSVKKRDSFGIVRGADEIERSLREMQADFALLTATPIKRLCYVGSDSYREGLLAGRELARRHPDGGRVIIAVPSRKYSSFALRAKGFTNAISEATGTFEILKYWEYHDLEEEIARYVSEEREPFDVLYVGEGNAPPRFVEALKKARILEGKLIVAHDTLPATMDEVRRGTIDVTISQQPYRQGYDPVVHVYNRIVGGVIPSSPRLLTELKLITKENVDSTQKDEDSLPELVDQRPSERVRVRFVGIGETEFWEPVYKAVNDARVLLEERNGTLDWFVPKGTRAGDRSGKVMVPAIDEAVRAGYHGIIVPVFDEATVEAVNRAVDRGVAVATYNGELLSFRGLATAVKQQAVLLRDVGNDVAASAEESRQAVTSIAETVQRVANKANEESEGITELAETLTSVAEEVSDSSEIAGRSSETAQLVRSESEAGKSAVDETAESLGQFRTVSEHSTRALSELSHGISEISEILGVIEEMAAQTNVLAINAAVEAARAGESGSGFKIVAGEIRSFARQASDAVERIGGIISNVQKESGQVESATNQILTQAQQSLQRIEHAQSALAAIDGNSQTNAQNMAAIVDSISSMREEANRVNERLKSLADELNRTTNAMGEIAGSTQEMSEQSKELAATAEKLRSSVHTIESVVSQFILE